MTIENIPAFEKKESKNFYCKKFFFAQITRGQNELQDAYYHLITFKIYDKNTNMFFSELIFFLVCECCCC